MRDRTLLLSAFLACGIHAIALALNFDFSRVSLASVAPVIDVALVAPSKPEPLPVLASAGSSAPASAPKKTPGPALKLKPAAKPVSKPEPKPVQAAELTPARIPELTPSLEPQPVDEPTDEVVVVEQSVPVATAVSAASPEGRPEASGGISGYGTGGAGGGGGVAGGSGTGGYGIGAGGSIPAYAFNPKPVYPPAARRDGQEGKTLLLVEVLSNGRVGKVKVEKSSGYKLLDEAAVEAVRKWRFTPAKKGKTPVTAWARVPIEFSLTD